MLEWDTKAIASYDCERPQALVLVTDRAGAIICRMSGVADDVKLAAVFALLEAGGKDGT